MAFNHGDLDQDTADRLLAGRLTPDDAPPGYGGVAQLLQRAHVDTGLDVTDDELVVAMVNAIVSGDPARKGRKHVLTRIVTTKVLVAGAVVALTATGAAAATGSLPDNAQNGLARAAEHIGINLPEAASDKAREKTHPADREPTASTTPAAEPTKSKTDADGTDQGDATTPSDPASAASNASTPTTDNHGSVVSQTAHDADPSDGKGDEVSPVARDNHGAEVRAEKQSPPTTTAGGPGNSNGHADPNSSNAPEHANAEP
jgi:hypothetical protein